MIPLTGSGAPLTAFDYEKMCKEAREKSLAVSGSKKIEVYSSLLSMNIEQLPTLSGRGDDLLEEYEKIHKMMIACGYDVMKHVAYDLSGNTNIRAILIKNDQEVTILQFTEEGFDNLDSELDIRQVKFLPKGMMSFVKISDLSLIGKLLFESSLATKSSNMHCYLESHLPATLVRIVNDYAGFPREGCYENFIGVKEHTPTEQTPFQYLHRIKQEVNESLHNVLNLIGLSHLVDMAKYWHINSRPILQNILTTQSSDGEERNYTVVEKDRIRGILNLGDTIDKRTFSDLSVMIMNMMDIYDQFSPFLFPIRKRDEFGAEILALTSKGNPRINSENENRKIEETVGKIEHLGKLIEIIMRYISII